MNRLVSKALSVMAGIILVPTVVVAQSVDPERVAYGPGSVFCESGADSERLCITLPRETTSDKIDVFLKPLVIAREQCVQVIMFPAPHVSAA